MSGSVLRTVARPSTRAEAVALASYLEGEGILAHVVADDAAGLLPSLSSLPRVVVAAADEDRAKALLRGWR